MQFLNSAINMKQCTRDKLLNETTESYFSAKKSDSLFRKPFYYKK